MSESRPQSIYWMRSHVCPAVSFKPLGHSHGTVGIFFLSSKLALLENSVDTGRLCFPPLLLTQRAHHVVRDQRLCDRLQCEHSSAQLLQEQSSPHRSRAPPTGTAVPARIRSLMSEPGAGKSGSKHRSLKLCR